MFYGDIYFIFKVFEVEFFLKFGNLKNMDFIIIWKYLKIYFFVFRLFCNFILIYLEYFF